MNTLSTGKLCKTKNLYTYHHYIYSKNLKKLNCKVMHRDRDSEKSRGQQRWRFRNRESKNCWQLKFNLWNISDYPRCLIGSTEIPLRQRLILLLSWQVYQLMIKHGRYSRKLYDNESLMFDRQKIIKLNCYMFKILRIMNSC